MLKDAKYEDFSVASQYAETPFTKQLVTTFKGNLTAPPPLVLPPEAEISAYLRRSIMPRKFNPLYYARAQLKNPTKLNLQAEYYQLDQKYNFSSYPTELPICVVAPGRNLVDRKIYQECLASLDLQNYSNYQLFIVDDASTDGTYDALRKKIQELPRLRTRTTLIRNEKSIGALGNKYLMIANHCEEGSIVFDVDADDLLIGRQVMKVMNALYQSAGSWFIYSNYVGEKKKKKTVVGLSRQIQPEVLAANNYRTS